MRTERGRKNPKSEGRILGTVQNLIFAGNSIGCDSLIPAPTPPPSGGIICKWPESFANGRNQRPEPESSVTPSLLLRQCYPGLNRAEFRSKSEAPNLKLHQENTRV